MLVAAIILGAVAVLTETLGVVKVMHTWDVAFLAPVAVFGPLARAIGTVSQVMVMVAIAAPALSVVLTH